jgi:hypothetical protein
MQTLDGRRVKASQDFFFFVLESRKRQNQIVAASR